MAGDSFKAVLLDMYEKKQGFDFKIHIDLSSKIFEAHKLVLALASETFYKAFYGVNAIRNGSALSLKGISDTTFEKILGFIYGKTIDFETLNDAGDFYKGCYTLKCKDALLFVTNYITQEITMENAIFIYEIAGMNENSKLIEACLTLFAEHTNTLINSAEFLSASPKTIDTIFKLDKLNIDSELELVRALEIYIKVNQETKPGIALKVRPALSSIRWLTLTAKDIAHTTLLSNNDIVNVIGSLPPEEDKSKMPPWLSLDTRRRNMTTPKKRMARLLHDKFTVNCFKCSTFNHSIWVCKKVFPPSRKQQLKKIYEKYGHTFLMEYNETDLNFIYTIFNEFKLLN